MTADIEQPLGELEAALSAASAKRQAAERRFNELCAIQERKRLGAANLEAAMGRHRDLMQKLDLGLADASEVEAARVEVLRHKADADVPFLDTGIADERQMMAEAEREMAAAHKGVVLSVGQAAAQAFVEASARAIRALSILEGIKNGCYEQTVPGAGVSPPIAADVGEQLAILFDDVRRQERLAMEERWPTVREGSGYVVALRSNASTSSPEF
jgi:hypothetical protein